VPIIDNVFYEFAVLLFVAVVIGGIATMFKQPLIVAFIAVGIIAGPTWLSVITAEESLDLLATMGIALLLFVVGLKLDLHLIRGIGPVALISGLGQVAFTSIIGYGICYLLLGMSPLTSLYVAVALTFSSTIIIVKLLSDKREIDSLHGRIAVGFLIVQDIVVVLVLIGLNSLGAGSGENTLLRESIEVAIKGILFIAAIALLMRYVLPGVTRFLARTPELLVLSAIAWAFVLAAAGDAMGFSKEVGAFLAGVSLASTPFREQIGARMVSLRDFLLLFFFLALGSDLDLSRISEQIVPAAILSIFVLIGNPLIVLVLMGRMGYHARTSFLAGLTVAQISEFSLILAALGLTLGHIDEQTLGLITLVGLITIGTSTYLILYSHPIYDRVAPWLKIFERKKADRDARHAESVEAHDVIIFGLGRYGTGIARGLKASNVSLLGIDFDPEAVHSRQDEGIDMVFGEADDPEFMNTLPLGQAHWIISTVPSVDLNLTVLRSVRQHGFDGKIAVTSHHEVEDERLRQAGADLILRPYADAAVRASEMIVESMPAKPEAEEQP
jgi:Kef-type K+ transport system membrane component KefB